MFAAMLLSIIPMGDCVTQRVDLIEINHFYSESAEPVFSQLIFYDWCDESGRYQVRAWRLWKPSQSAPQRRWKHGGYSITWKDGETMRQIIADSFRETWTQYDRELVEREFLPKEKRRELMRNLRE